MKIIISRSAFGYTVKSPELPDLGALIEYLADMDRRGCPGTLNLAVELLRKDVKCGEQRTIDI